MRLSRQTSGLLRALDCFSQGIMLVDTSTSDWSIVFVNDAWVTITGIQREKGLGGAMWQLCKPARAGDEVSPASDSTVLAWVEWGAGAALATCQTRHDVSFSGDLCIVAAYAQSLPGLGGVLM